jgi:hypothetical protein
MTGKTMSVRQRGQYFPLIKGVLSFPHGQLRSIIIKVQHNCTSDRRQYGKLEDPPLKHEYRVVFKKAMQAGNQADSGSVVQAPR